MSQKLHLNLNTKCRVKLTPFGEKVLFDKLYSFIPTLRQPNESFMMMSDSETNESFKMMSDPLYTWPLHELFYYFGSETYMGNTQICFENNNIEVVE